MYVSADYCSTVQLFVFQRQACTKSGVSCCLLYALLSCRASVLKLLVPSREAQCHIASPATK